MADIVQTLGFDASGAIAALTALKAALDGANASLGNFSAAAKIDSKAGAALKAVADGAGKVAPALSGISAAAQSAGTGLGQVSAAATSTATATKGLAASMAALPSSMSGFAAAMKGFDAQAARINAMKNAAAQLPAKLAALAAAAAPAAAAVAKIPAASTGFAAAQARMDALAERIKIVKGVAEAAAAATAKSQAPPQGFAESMKRHDELIAKIKAAKAEAAKSAPPIKISINTQAIAAAQAALTGLRVTVNGLGSVFSMLGLTIQGAFRLVGTTLKTSVSEAMAFGLAVAEIQTIAGSFKQTNEQLTASILNLSNSLGKSAKDVAEGLYQTLSNQVVEAADAMRFLEEAEKLAITTHATTAQSVDALSSIMNSYGLSISEVSHVSDMLFETVFQGRLRLDEIADRIGRITPMAAQLGISFEEVGAAIAVMTVQGVKADTAITQLRAVITKLLKPTEETQKMFDSWGVVDAKQAFAAFGGIYGVLQKLSKEVGGSSAEMSKFFNVVRGMTGQMGLATDGGKRFAEAIAQMEGATGRASEAWRVFLASDAQKLTIQINELKNSFIALGTTALPYVVGIGEALARWAEKIAFGLRVMAAFGDPAAQYFLAAELAMKKGAEETAKALKDTSNNVTAAEKKDYNERSTAFKKMLADMVVADKGAMDAIESQSKVALASLQAGLDKFTDSFKDSYKGLEDFVDNASKGFDDAIKGAQGRRQELEDRKREQYKEKGDKSDLEKAKIDAEAAYKEINKARAALNAAGADANKNEVAQAAVDRAIQMSDQAAASYKSAGASQSKINRLNEQSNSLLQTASNQFVNQAKLQQDNLGGAKATLDVLKGQSEELKTLSDLYKANAVKQTDKSLTTGQIDILKKEAAELEKAMEKIWKSPEYAAAGAFMDSLQIPNTVKEAIRAFDEGFKNVKLKFQLDRDNLDAQVEKLDLQVDVKLNVKDPEAFKAAVDAVVGESKPGVSRVQDYRDAVADYEATQAKFEKTQQEYTQATTKQARNVEDQKILANSAKRSVQANLKSTIKEDKSFFERLADGGAPGVNVPSSSSKTLDKVAVREAQLAAELIPKFEEVAEKFAIGGVENKAANEAALADLLRQVEEYNKLGYLGDGITKTFGEWSTKIQETVTGVGDLEATLETLEAKLLNLKAIGEEIKAKEPAKPEVTEPEKLSTNDQLLKDKQDREKEAAEALNKEMGGVGEGAGEAAGKVDGVTTSLNNATGSADKLNTGVVTTGTSAVTTSSAMGTVATSTGCAADKAITMSDTLAGMVGFASTLLASWTSAATKPDDAATGASNLNANTLAAIGSAQTLIGVWNSVAAAAREAAAASAAAQSAAASAQTAVAFSGGKIDYLAAGGRGSDRIPAMLAKGEFVSSAKTAGRFFSELNAMNNGSRPAYREQGGAVTNVGDVNVTVKGGDSSQQTVREIGHALRREIQRGNIKLK